jgi:hypothetical protein
MADTNAQNTTQVEQPTQQTEVKTFTEHLSSLERAKRDDARAVLTLGAKEAYNELELFGTEAGEYSETSPIQGQYWRFKFRGAICTVSPEFKKAYDDGTLLSITATPTVFEQKRPDPNVSGASKMVVGYGWSLSFSDLSKMKKAQSAIKAASDIELQMQIQEAKMKKKVEAFMAADLSSLITEEDMKQMLADA